MALVFADGFDHYNVTDILKKWTGLANASIASEWSIGPAYARAPGGMGLQHFSGNAGRCMYKSLPATYTSFVVGFAIYFVSAPPSGTTAPFLFLWDSSTSVLTTYQLCLRGDAASHLVVATGATAGTVLATSTNTFSAGVWYHIEFKATINNTTGTYEVRVNGSSTGWIPAATGKNTRGESSNNYIDTVGISSGAVAGGAYIDDFYFLSSASPNNDFQGPIKVITAFPIGAGHYSDWSGNFATNFVNVQELAGDGDNTFNQTGTATNKDTFLMDQMPAGTIVAVQDVMMARQDAGAARTVRTKYRVGSSDYNGSTFNLAGSYQFLCDPSDVDPATSSAYTVSGFNSEERGYELVS